MRIRVLVTEDHPLVREAVVGALSQDPALEVVGEAATGRDALALAEELRPDVVVLDLHMPELGGLAVIDKLRQSRPEIRVVVLSASEEPSTVLDAIAAGASGYLSKRSVGEELRRAVIEAHGGGSIITPALARHLLSEFAATARGEMSERCLVQGREADVLRLVAQGMTDTEIGRQLYISPRTVQTHLTNIRQKTGVRRRAELARWAVEHAMA